MRRWLILPLFTMACFPGAGSPQPEPVTYYSGDIAGCVKVQQVCLNTNPPQCFDYCADVPPNVGTCTGSGDVMSCDGQECVVGKDASGDTVGICVGADCTISTSTSTGEVAISCIPADAGPGGDAAGIVDGNSGQ